MIRLKYYHIEEVDIEGKIMAIAYTKFREMEEIVPILGN
jgi:hypothetical protein